MAEMSIADIKIGERHRRDMGDIDALAANIAVVGLLHPVVVTPAGRLIAGERRIRAFRQLGRGSIPTTVVDLKRIAHGEYAENFFRKAFTPSEMVAIAEAIEPAEREKAKQRQGERTDKHPGKFPPSQNGAALDHVAKAVGKDRKTITKAKEVVAAAKADPQRFGGLQEQMDATGKVDAAYKKLKTIEKRAEFDAAVIAGTATPGDQEIINGDCLVVLEGVPSQSVDVVVTSPPYNIGIDYRSHNDNMDRGEYIGWLGAVFEQLRRVLKPKGSFFLNIGDTREDPWLEADIAMCVIRGQFRLQNHIVWVKAIAVGEEMIGHYKPINSKRFLNQNYESIFHLTLNGDVEIDRLAVGVPFGDKSNIERRDHAFDLHCAGDTWFIPYETAQSKDDKFHHPASFPVGLAERCIKLHGMREGLTVLDPFLGSGSTLVACKHLRCRGIGVEIDPHYAKVAAVRLGDAD